MLEGINLMPEMTVTHREKAHALLKADADKILRLIEVQIKNLTMPQCPLYEEVLDTQMFGLSREIDFAVRLNLITERDRKSTRLNSSHVAISYAVFCLKKKKKRYYRLICMML